MEIAALLFVLAGHAFLWIGLTNRLHAIGMRRRIIKRITIGFFLCAAAIPIVIGCRWYTGNLERPTTASWGGIAGGGNAGFLVAAYVALCGVVLAVTILRLVYLRCLAPTSTVIRFHGRRSAEINPHSAAAGMGENAHHFLTRLPWNEMLRLEVSDWMLDVPRLPPALDGLSIVHFSDLHFTGCIGKAFFREVVRTSNELQPDLVAVTGDIVDRPACLDWIADTLGGLTAAVRRVFHPGQPRSGRGRHRPGSRSALEQSGLVDLGGRERRIEIAGHPLLMAGNQRPWIDGAGGPASPCSSSDPLRIALAHSPDQLRWARAWNADLMLAGHTHGGQICIPPLGAIFSPTWRGVRYVSGVFYAPPTILHVTRGLSGDVPLRWNCSPEIALLRLHAGRRAVEA